MNRAMLDHHLHDLLGPTTAHTHCCEKLWPAQLHAMVGVLLVSIRCLGLSCAGMVLGWPC